MHYMVGAKYFCGPLPTINGTYITISKVRAAAILDLPDGDGELEDLLAAHLKCDSSRVTHLVDYVYITIMTSLVELRT